MEMKRYKVVVIDKSMGTFFEEQTYFIEYYDIKSIIMLISEEQEIVKIELIEDEEDEEEIEQLMECDYEDLKDDKSIN